MIDHIDRIERMKLRIAEAHAAGRAVGFVPTMGALHEGHLSLVRRAREQSDIVVASVFVNPTQFAPGEDLERYPRDLDGDRERLAGAGADVLFTTTPQEMYPDGYDTWVVQERTVAPLCGASRPGHFRGVLTIVLKLFNIVRPDRAYFGEKDYQQCQVIRRMVADLDLDVTVVACPIVRDADGLALSSRNAYLTDDERRRGLSLRAALDAAAAAVADGERSGDALRALMRERLERGGVSRVDYAAVVDAATLADVETITGPARALVAAYVGETRLIDNAPIELP